MGRRDHERIEQEPTGAADKVAEVLARLYRAADRWPRVNPQELQHLERLLKEDGCLACCELGLPEVGQALTFRFGVVNWRGASELSAPW